MASVSRVYDSYAQARSVVRDLEAAGIPSADISIIANKYVSGDSGTSDLASSAGTGAGIGAALGGAAGLLAGVGLMAIPGLGPVVAAGWLASTAVGAAGGAAAGGLIGALVDAGLPEEDAHVYSEAIRRGGTMVSVRIADAQEFKVEEIMERHGPIDAETRRQLYRDEGWDEFATEPQPYWIGDADSDRMRRE